MMFTIGIVLFALAILLSVALHECGHMWVARATGMSPVLLYTSTTIGGLATGISPFSAGGAMVLGFTDKDERDDMFHREFAVGLPVCVGAALVVSFLCSLVLG